MTQLNATKKSFKRNMTCKEGGEMSDTPRTDAVLEAAKALPWGSVVQAPDSHPVSDPWELARQLERENNVLRDRLIKHLKSLKIPY